MSKLLELLTKYGRNHCSTSIATYKEQIGYHNTFADFWRYVIGVNVIPADTRKKVTYEKWSDWQDKPISEELHSEWKAQNAFSRGMGIIVGKVWHREDKKGLYFTFIDTDNLKAIENICTRNGKSITLQTLAEKFLVEQHLDNPNKAHIYFYSPIPFAGKSSDIRFVSSNISNTSTTTADILADKIPAFEVKGQGKHGISFCTPSIHKDGSPYEVIGTLQPITLNEKQAEELQQHLYDICKKYGIRYGAEDISEKNGNGKALTPIQELFRQETKIYQGHNRHEALLRVMESLIVRNKGILSPEQVKQNARDWNNEHCNPPLDKKEFEKQWHDGLKFIAKRSSKDEKNIKNDDDSYDSNLLYSKIVQKGKPPSDILYDIANEKIIKKFRDALTNEPYAVYLVDGHRKVVCNMESEDFRYFLRRIFEEDYNYQQKEFFEPYKEEQEKKDSKRVGKIIINE
jgi:hypothetical protein